jgi:hypothetical protein
MVRVLGPDIQIAGGPGSQNSPAMATQSDGRIALVYQTDVSGGTDPIAALNVNTIVSTITYVDLFPHNGFQTQPVIAALSGGAFGTAFGSTNHADGTADTSRNIVYVRVASNGTLGTPLAIGDLNGGGGQDDLSNAAIATLSTGRQVVAFERFNSGFEDIFLNVVSADWASTQFSAAAPLTVAGSADFQADPVVGTIGNSALVVYEDATGTSTGSRNIFARIFDGTSNTLGVPITIADHAAALTNPKVTALDDQRYVVIYSDANDIWGRIYDSSNNSLSAEFEIDQPAGGDGQPAVAATINGGFIVAWTQSSGGPATILARRFDSQGVALGAQFSVGQASSFGKVGPSVTVNGGSAFIAWTDSTFSAEEGFSPPSVRGQSISLTTPPDFNSNGLSDIMWRSTSGGLALWDINQSGAIAGSGLVKSEGASVAPDASWTVAAISDFNADGRADLLWHNTSGALALWTMNGATIVSSFAVMSNGIAIAPDASWSTAGAGDFNADGTSDLLWRNTNGSLVVWTMNGPFVAGSGSVTAGGSAVNLYASWSVAGIGDLDADGHADILWRNANGEVATWFMSGSTIAGSADVTSGGVAVRPDASWSVAGIGDFDADGHADILWRNTTGSLVEWLMNGSTISSSGFVSVAGTPVAPDASWHVVEIGDFNDDARTDMLWRSDSGALAEWLMNGTTITSSFAPSSGGTPIGPDPSWQVQAKPTDFA